MADTIAEAESEIILKEAQNDLLLYTTICDPTYIVSKVHILLAQKLQAVAEGKIKRLIISQPPRTGKTRAACVEMPSWCLGRFPDTEIIVAGHSLNLPIKSSRETRSRLSDPVHQAIFENRIVPGDSRIDEWGTVGGGRYKAVGVGGAILGRGARIAICDDLLSGWEAAHSPTQLEKIWEWFWGELRTRLTEDGGIVLIMSRLSRQDPVGRVLDPERLKDLAASGDVMASENWEVINLPALAEANDALGRAEGESIYPEKWSAAHYRNLRATSLHHIWAAMYEGRPVLSGGNYIEVVKIRIVDAEDVPKDLRWARGWDLATSEKQQDDETAGISAAQGPDETMYLKDLIHGHWKWPQARERIKQTAMAERIAIGIEAVAGFKTSYANLLEVIPAYITCTEYNVSKDKLTRALPWIALVPKGKLALVRGDWNVDFLLQAERFSGKADEENDVIDATSIAAHMVMSGIVAPIPIRLNDRLQRAWAARRDRSLEG